MKNWQSRLLIGMITAAAGLLALWTAHIPYWQIFFLFMCVAIITTASWELLQLSIRVGASPLITLSLTCIALYVFSVYLGVKFPAWHFLPEFVLLGTVAAVFLYHFYIHEHPINTISYSLFPFAYLAIPLSTCIPIVYFFPENSNQDGRLWLLFLLLVVKINDVAAYVIGKTLGKHPLTRYISPKKTWEGALAGLTVAAITGALLSPLLSISVATGVLLSLALTIAAQFGDLSESLLKRDAGTKDSNSLPGLGGVLDVVDALVFSCPLLYIFLKFHFTEAVL